MRLIYTVIYSSFQDILLIWGEIVIGHPGPVVPPTVDNYGSSVRRASTGLQSSVPNEADPRNQGASSAKSVNICKGGFNLKCGKTVAKNDDGLQCDSLVISGFMLNVKP